MNISKITHLLITLVLSSLSSICTQAQEASNAASGSNPRSKTFLILNSYNEYSPWTRSMVTPITYYIANNEDVHAELINLNSVMITDSAKYEKVRSTFFEDYADKKVDYVAFIGQMAFSFHSDIKKKWGDIPMLLITRDLTFSDPSTYYSGFDYPVLDTDTRSISEIRNEYNLTAVYVPDCFRETIELMLDLNPNMEELLFFSDGAYYNRTMSVNIETYLLEDHPDIKYKWVKADAENDLELQYFLVHDVPKSGLLISSWFYEKRNALGYPSVVMGDLNLLYSSANPVFALRYPYMDLGAVGGVYPNPEMVHNAISNMVERIVNGESPRNIKIFSSRNATVPILNYKLMKEYGLREDRCPPNAQLIGKPQSFLEKYYWQAITFLVAFVLITFLFIRRNMAQRREIEILQRNKKFLENMPLPFSKARVLYNNQRIPETIHTTMYNEAFGKIIKDNVKKGHIDTLLPTDLVTEKVRELVATGKPVAFTHHFEKTDTYYVFTICSQGDDPNVDVIDIFASDITERQKNDKRLRELTQQLDMTIGVANIVPWEWDMVNDLMYFGTNDLFKRYDKPVANTLDKKDWCMVPTSEFMKMIVPEDKEEVRHIREQLYLGKIKQFHFEYRVKLARGGKEAIEWVDVNGTVFDFDGDGKPIRLLGSMVLVTERKKQESELIEAREQAYQANHLKSAFLANISHEIRTPLSAIIGFSQLLCENNDPEKREEFKVIIKQNYEVLSALINDMLDLSKIEAGTIDIHISDVDLNSVIQVVASSVKQLLKPDVVLNIANGYKSCILRADSNRLSQVLINLLSNAAKFTMRGSITIGYNIVDGDKVKIYIKDTGIGISKDNQRHLFKRFGKLNQTIQGNGLGLSISKNLVELMGGEVGIDSKGEGFGATFWFTLPYKKDGDIAAEDTPKQLAHPQEVNEVDAEADDEAKERSSKLVLIAEDIEGNYLLLKHLIPSEYELLHAWNGREAVDMYRKYRPDIVLMDINMPILDGYGATKEIRQFDAEVPIVAVTAYAYASDRKRILTNGFTDFIAKPIKRDELSQVIKKYLF